MLHDRYGGGNQDPTEEKYKYRTVEITSGLHKQIFLDLHLFVKLRKLCSRNSRDHVPGRS